MSNLFFKEKILPHLIGFLFLNLTGWANQKPNMIVIMCDDLGYADVGFNGCKDIPTPQIDSIAENGVKCINGYVAYPVCGPSELSQPAPDNHFLRMFGQSSRDLVNDSSVEGSIPQSLMLMNGGVQNLLYDRDARHSKMLRRSGDFKSAVQFLFLSFFCRPPTPDEMNTIEQAIAEGMKKEDLTWALFNSTEFLFVQ